MQRLYQFYLLFKEYILLCGFIVLCLILLSANDNVQIRRIRALTVGVIGMFQSSFTFIPNIFALQSENEILRRVNVNLADEVNKLREARLENIRLRSMLALQETTKFHFTGGKVVGKNLTLLRNTLTLNIGEDEGVQIGNPIVSGEGLVGRVISASGNYSIVQIVQNVDFRASAKVQRSRVDGIIAWDGRSLLLKNVPKSLDVRQGDAIITSEYSNAFPSDIKIGIVNTVSEIPGDLFKRIEVRPTVDFVALEEAFAINYVPSLEKIRIEEKHQK